MDVTCERCGTEYEFDETLVSDRGTTVKCTQCGHLFKVFRPGGASSGAPEAMWRVRRRDGVVETVPTLRDLQRRIIQGAFRPDDEISASGQPWKKLGDIAELESFFASTAGARVPSSAPPRNDATVPFEVHRPASDPAEPPRPPLPPPRREKRTLMGVGVPVAGATIVDPPRSAPPPPPGARATSVPPPPPKSAPPPAKPSSRPPAKPSSRPPAADATVPGRGRAPSAPGSGSARSSRPPPPPPTSNRPPSNFPRERRSAAEHEAPASLRVSQADAVPARASGGKGATVAVAVAAVALLAVGFSQRDRLASLFGAEDDRVGPFLELGSSALARDEVEAYQTAVFELTRATAIDARDARALAGLARAHAAWAQSLAFEALDHDARAVTAPVEAGEARRARSEMARHAAAAKRFAEDAVRADPSLADAALALADALRLEGDVAGAEEQLGRVRQAGGAPEAELHRVAGLLAAAQAGGDLSRARDEAARAVEAEPGIVRHRVLYARALFAAGDVPGARRELAAAGEDHEMVRPLLALIEAGAIARPIDEVAQDAPERVGEPATATPAPEAAPTATTPATATPAAAPSEGVAPSGRDYAWYVRRGDSLLSRGDFDGARTHYEAALAARPGASEALTGLGHAALRTGNAPGAVTRFRQATQNGYLDAYVGLGDAYRRMNQEAEALRAYERYLERAPSGAHAAVARRRIDELRGTGGGSAAAPREASPTNRAAPGPTETPSGSGTATPAPSEPAPSALEAPAGGSAPAEAPTEAPAPEAPAAPPAEAPTPEAPAASPAESPAPSASVGPTTEAPAP